MSSTGLPVHTEAIAACENRIHIWERKAYYTSLGKLSLLLLQILLWKFWFLDQGVLKNKGEFGWELT